MITPHSISGSFNEYLYNFVRPFEAFRQRVYSDPRGIPTLGVGYALVIYSDVLGRWELRDTLQSDLRAA
jgi:GH24 family phage-related lysozyme (muramidase)